MLRQRIVAAIRSYFDSESFLEAEVPLAIVGTCPDLHINSIEIKDGGYLTTSTEYQIKRLVAGGFERVYTLTKNFRAREVSDFHNPEFTMLEWSRAHKVLPDIEADAEEVVKRGLEIVSPGASTLRFGGHEVSIHGVPWERLTVRDAFRRYLNAEVDEGFSAESLLSAAEQSGIVIPASIREDARDLTSLLLTHVQPHLGVQTPTFLKEWPAFETSSAAQSEHAQTLADRSELFIAGVEIADGFPSLLDAEKQRASFESQLAQRRAAGYPVVDLDMKYISALEEGLPLSAGMALGVDRLIMVLTGTDRIRDVLSFAWDER